MLPGISFVVPAHNRASLLLETLSSVVNQKYQGKIELIVVDDASKPSLKLSVHANFPKVTIIRTKVNQGPAAARNLGLKKTTYPYVCFLDSDDLLEPNFCQEMVSTAATHQVPVVCLSKTLFDKKISLIKKALLQVINMIRNVVLSFHGLLTGTLPRALFFGTSTSRIVFPKKILTKYSFNEGWRQCEEWELLLRVMDFYPVRILPKKLIWFRFTTNSETHRQQKKQGTNKYRELLSRLSFFEQLHPGALLFRVYSWLI